MTTIELLKELTSKILTGEITREEAAKRLVEEAGLHPKDAWSLVGNVSDDPFFDS